VDGHDEQAPLPQDDALPGEVAEDVAAVVPDPEHVAAEMMSLLEEGVPLALIADLAAPGGPSSPDILEDEGLPDVAWWGDGEREPAEDLPAGDDHLEPEDDSEA